MTSPDLEKRVPSATRFSSSICNSFFQFYLQLVFGRITEASSPYDYGTTATAPTDLNGTTYDYGPIPLADGPHTIRATPMLSGSTGAATTLTFNIGP